MPEEITQAYEWVDQRSLYLHALSFEGLNVEHDEANSYHSDKFVIKHLIQIMVWLMVFKSQFHEYIDSPSKIPWEETQ